MDGKTSSKLTGLISKLTAAANKAVTKKNHDQQYTKRPERHEFSPNLNLTQLKNNLRTA
ncbi:MAG: hypothetical protein R2825_05390 [Saprospiraceae bacterium]|jgi:hypothetical protein